MTSAGIESTPLVGGEAQRVKQLRELLGRNADRLGLQQASLRSPRPGVLSARTGEGDLVTLEVRVYRRGQW